MVCKGFCLILFNFSYLHGILKKNEKMAESNKKIIVEALRAISEILIWGDQNDSTVFE